MFYVHSFVKSLHYWITYVFPLQKKFFFDEFQIEDWKAPLCVHNWLWVHEQKDQVWTCINNWDWQ